MQKKSVWIILASVAMLSLPALADVKLPAIIGDNMVIQQGVPFKIWGWADAGEKVTVSIGDSKAEATADENGKWLVKLNALKATSEPMEMTVAGKNDIKVKNILVGEVWVCSGQSNMEWNVASSQNGAEEVEKANHPTIRLFNIAPSKHVAEKPEDNVRTCWDICKPENIRNFSGVGYFFGRQLNEALKVPVGLINAPWGGSPVEQWIPMDTYKNDPELADLSERIDKEVADFPKQKEAYPAQLENWKATTQKAAETSPTTRPAQNRPPQAPQHPFTRYGGMFNGNIAPITNYAIKGVIWYQGESNAGNAKGYRKSFPAMIRGWRKAWDQGEFPFLYVQLANFMDRPTDPNNNSDWARLRESQLATLSTPKTGMAVAIDVGNPKDIHPKDKQTVGKRLALAAEAIAYDMKDVVYSGPIFDSMKIQDNKVILSFKHVGGGLEAKGEKLVGFALAGEDKKYFWADAKIDGNTVVLTCDKVEKPAMVRYGWGNDPECNLYNKEGLPASPFRAGEVNLDK